MKDKGISRNIGAGGRRSGDEVPGLDRFQKRAGQSDPAEELTEVPVSPKGERRRRRVVDDGRYYKELDEKRMKSALLLWTLLLSLTGVAVLVLFVVFWFKPYLQQRDRMAATSPHVDQYVPIEEVIEKGKLGETESIALAKRAMAARTEEEVAAVVDPGIVPVSEVVAYLKAFHEVDGEITGYSWMPRLDTLREDISGVVVTFTKDGEKGNRIALFAPDGEGGWKMDFPAFARLASPSWENLLSGKADSAVVRVYLEKDQYFNGPFREDAGWVCYGVASPDVEQLVFGYCKSGSSQAKAIQALLNFKKMARATVVLEKAEEGDKRQFVIKRVLAHDWVVGDEPADKETR